MLPLVLTLLLANPVLVSRTPTLLDGLKVLSVSIDEENQEARLSLEDDWTLVLGGPDGQVTSASMYYGTRSEGYQGELPALGSQLGRVARSLGSGCFGLPAAQRQVAGARVWETVRKAGQGADEWWAYDDLRVQAHVIAEPGYSRTLGDSGVVEVPPEVSVSVNLSREPSTTWTPNCRWR
ncbi:hypothetical protein K7W42_04665 [Deinococcus sp. HMF7604]|uniref:hypothetical protein n=1 Tax=Deinococcus betulae TaxID=2873312 RepID=UPI001CCC0AD8|nr:hypothetical protein [Deinococcus betulae]MBZ9750152.1 hypothetical protein [Deinococcus betulae]